MQRDSALREPGMFLSINHQNPWKQLHLMIEYFQSNRSGQKGGVHEHAPAEWDIVGNRTWLLEYKVGGRKGSRHVLVCEGHLNVCDRQPRLVNDQRRIAGRVIREGNFPWTFSGATVFDFAVEERVADHGQEKGQNEMLERPVTFHVAT